MDDRNRPLTEEGLADSQKVMEVLRDKKIDVFISSPYRRSYDTIKLAAESYGKQIETDERLRVNAPAVLAEPDMQMRAGGFAGVARYGHHAACRDDLAFLHDDGTQMAIETFHDAMVEDDIVPVASVATVYFLNSGR